jgi:hypothetical protein
LGIETWEYHTGRKWFEVGNVGMEGVLDAIERLAWELMTGESQ